MSVPGPAAPTSGTSANPTACPRCARAVAPGSGPFCAYCGRYLAALEWVAMPPDPASLPEAARPRRRIRSAQRYLGPPRYREIPRWGLPPGPWPGASTDGGRPTPLRQARATAAQLLPVLTVTAAVAGIATVAEVWRYVLLLFSRSDALSPAPVAWSDSLVWFGGWASLAGLLASGVLLVQWSLYAMRAAAQRSGTRPPRSSVAVVLGWVVPGPNLVAPGAVLAEIEHSALGLPHDERPRPTIELRLWWLLWAAGVVLTVVTLLWSLRSGTQALADGVVLHAWVDALAVATAVLTRRVVRRLTELLEPSTGERRELLVRTQPPAA